MKHIAIIIPADSLMISFILMVGSAGLEPAKPEGRRFTVSGNCRYTNYPFKNLVLEVGLEPTR